MNDKTAIVVLKFGSSVLRDEAHLDVAVEEIYRHHRQGSRVVAVVSAFAGRTDALFAEAHSLARNPRPEVIAAQVARGELECVSRLGLALDHAGLDAALADAGRLGLMAEGHLLDASPVAVDAERVLDLLAGTEILVVPGFLGRDAHGATALFGRGGSDLSALFLAHRLQADRCLLVKDTEGVFERDPNQDGPPPRRYSALSFHDALVIDGRVIQRKALHFAAINRVRFEVAAPGSDRVTLVGADETLLEEAPEPSPPLRVRLVGHGQVGAEVTRRLRARPDRWDLVGVGVRRPEAHAELPPELVETDLTCLARRPADVVCELIGGIGAAARIIEDALVEGIPVVTANKELLAARGPALIARALATGAALKASAAVGGVVPVLERTAALARRGPIISVSGILNGTGNHVLDRLAEGLTLAEAISSARRAGLCEQHPSDDLEGRDALRKLVLISRIAFQRDPDVLELGAAVSGSTMGSRPRQLATLVVDDDDVITARVAVDDDPEERFRACRGERNLLRFRLADGTEHWLGGRGAGPAPTAEAVLADLLDHRREQEARRQADAAVRKPS